MWSRLQRTLTGRHRSTLLCALAGLIAAAATALFYSTSLDADQQRHMESFGRALAAQLATLSAEPMIGGDHLSLGVLASRISEPAEVASVSVYTVDDRMLAITGTAPSDAPRFIHPIVFEDTVAGYARIELDPSVFRTGPGGVALLLWILGCGLVSLLAAHLAGSDWRLPSLGRGREAPEPEPVAAVTIDPPQPSFLLVVNWFNQVSFPPAERIRVIDLCLTRAERVGTLYGARGTELPGTGLLLAFNGAPTDAASAERCFQVVCAALLISDVLHSVNDRQFLEGRPQLEFRFGLHEDRSGVQLDQLAGADCTADTVLLSAVAANGHVAVSREVFAQLDQPGRLTSLELTHPILASLTTATAGGCTVVSALEDSYRALLDRQAERLLDRA